MIKDNNHYSHLFNMSTTIKITRFILILLTFSATICHHLSRKIDFGEIALLYAGIHSDDIHFSSAFLTYMLSLFLYSYYEALHTSLFLFHSMFYIFNIVFAILSIPIFWIHMVSASTPLVTFIVVYYLNSYFVSVILV